MVVDSERQCKAKQPQHSDCSLKLTVFACWCCVASLLLHVTSFGNDGIETVLDEKAREILIQQVDEELDGAIQAYLKHADLKYRTRRDATFDPWYDEASTERYVEFFNSASELELATEDLAWTSSSETSDGIDWVNLTDSSRIAYDLLQEFCLSTLQYCPAGELGPKGPPGYPGPEGDLGFSGFPGVPGYRGLRGVDGLKGSKGHRGDSGSKGPSGGHGPLGHGGARGFKGNKGAAGANGIVGDQGPRGLVGPPGPKGDRGYYLRVSGEVIE